jgi:hypothetical protein
VERAARDRPQLRRGRGQRLDRGRRRQGPDRAVRQLDFSQTYETVDWSQVRYADYGFIALDVTPARHGRRTTMVLRFINQQGRELDRVVFTRVAGA